MNFNTLPISGNIVYFDSIFHFIVNEEFRQLGFARDSGAFVVLKQTGISLLEIYLLGFGVCQTSTFYFSNHAKICVV